MVQEITLPLLVPQA